MGTVAGVRLDVDGPRATVTLCDPGRRNAQTPDTWRRLAAIGTELPAAVRVVVLQAEGPAFSAGLDRTLLQDPGGEEGFLAELAGLPDTALDARLAGYQDAFTWWSRPGLLSVAAVAGPAVGAGCQLALACDLRLCADDARLAIREPALGLVPDLGGTGALVAAVGYARALEICLTGRWVEAAEAVRTGLALAAVPRAELAAATEDLVAALLAAPAAAAAVTAELLRGARQRTPAQQLAAERAAQALLLRALAHRR